MITIGFLLLVAGAGALVVNGAAWLDASRNGARSWHRSPVRRTLVFTGTAAVAVGNVLVWTALLS